MSGGTTRRRSVPSLAVHDPEKAGRGSLTVTTAVVEKVAARIAAEPRGLGAPSTSVFGSRSGSRADFERGPKVRAVVAGQTADLDVEVAIRYPAPVQEACDDLRRRLVEEVPRLAGVSLGTVDIVVSRVVREAEAGKELG